MAEPGGLGLEYETFLEHCGDDSVIPIVCPDISCSLLLGTQGRSDRPPGRNRRPTAYADQEGVSSRKRFRRAPPHGGPASWQAAAALCRPHRRVRLDACRRHALRHSRLHVTTPFELACCDSPSATSLQEVWPFGPRCRSHKPRPRPARRPSHVARNGRRRAPPLPPPPFSTRTHHAGVFLTTQGVSWSAKAEQGFADVYTPAA